MEEKRKNFLIFLLFSILSLILFFRFFLFGKIPVPGDILIGHYHPLKDVIWEGRTAGFPIKNFLLFDGIRQTLPWRLLAIDIFKSGKWPFWNPYNLGGTPLLANWQTAALYPLNFLFFIFEKYTAWGLYLAFQPLLAGFFAYLFFKSLDLDFLSAVFGAVAFAFSGMMLNHLEFGVDGHSSLWLPLMLYGVNLIVRGKNRLGFFTLIMAALCNLLAGYPPPIIYNFVALGFWTLLNLKKVWIRKLFLLVIAIILAAFLAAPQLLPTLELVDKVERRPEFFGEQSGETHFFPIENLLMTIAPDFFGHPSTGNFFSKVNYTDSPYIGFWPLVFAFLTILVIYKSKSVIFGWFIVIATLVLMISNSLALAVRKIPIPFVSSVSPMRMLWLTGFGLALLSALGFEYFWQKFKKKKFLIVIIPVILLAVVWDLSGRLASGWQINVARRNLLVPTLSGIAGVGIIFLSIFVKKTKNLMKFGLVGLLFLELVRQGWKYNPFIDQKLIYPKTKILSFLSERPKTERILITHQELLPANANMPYKYSMVDGYFSMYDARAGQMASLVNAPGNLQKIGGFPRIVYLSDPASKILDLLNVNWVMALEQQKNPKLELVMKEGETYLYRNKEALPKVFFVDDVISGKDDLDIAGKVLKVNLIKTAVVEKDLAADSFSVGKAKIIDYKEGFLSIETENAGGGFLVVSENFDPNWQVFTDSGQAKIYRADYNLIGVKVPGGNKKVVLRYSPGSFFKGIKLFFVGLIILIFCFKTRYLKDDTQEN